MFDLEFISDEPEPQDEGADAWLALRGRATLGDYKEEFLAPIGYWTRGDYERQWIAAARRLLTGADRTGFFTQALRFWWVIWREGGDVFVHEQILVEDASFGPLDPADPYRQIGERYTVSEDGEQVSEWRLEIADIEGFVERRAAQYVPVYLPVEAHGPGDGAARPR